MAGFVSVSGKTGRKQWTLHDGSKSSLRRLRSQLAEDGCPESQVVLAKQLLDETSDLELEVDKEENAKLGVYWLTKASEQGNIEATEILKTCLVDGRGITEHNYYDVKNCLDMSQDEKLARRAARELFTSLSNGEDFITTEQLQRCIKDAEISSNKENVSDSSENKKHKVQKSLEGNDFEQEESENEFNQHIFKDKERIQNIIPDWSEHKGEKISESSLVSAATSYARGTLPIISKSLCLSDTVQNDLNSVPLLHRPFIHPLTSLKKCYSWLVETIGQKGIKIRQFFSLELHIFILLLIHTLLGTESVLLFIPVILYYISLTVMIIATFQILQRKRELNYIRLWSRLFQTYSNGNLNPEEAEYQFCRNNLKPYGHFFLALFLNLVLYSIISHQWLPQSEFTVIALVLTLITLTNFSFIGSKKPDFLIFFSFCLNVLARYPYEMDSVVTQNWRFLDFKIPNFASYLVGNGIEFCLNFRFIFYLLMPLVLGKIASRDNWRGTCKFLIPHCVTLSWWQMAILNSQGATMYGLIRGALAMVGTVLFLPIIGFASIFLPIIATAKYMSENDVITRIVFTMLFGGFPFLASWYLRKSKCPQKFNWLITSVQIILGLSAGLFLIWPMFIEHKAITSGPANPFEMNTELTWDQYQNYCHQPAWEESSSKAQIQEQCSYLEGIPISWEGYVTSVKVKSVKNNLAYILNQLPNFLASPLKCLFGEYHVDNCDNIPDGNAVQKMNCKIFYNIKRKQNKCHVSTWNSFEFEISVKMKNGLWGSNTEIQLIGDQSFANFSLNMYPGDKIWFSGTLLNNGLESENLLGGLNPHIYLNEIGCHVCHSTNLKAARRKTYSLDINDFVNSIYSGTKTILNFFFNPMITFK